MKSKIPILCLVDEFFKALGEEPPPLFSPPPYADWDKARLDEYIGGQITPLPAALQHYIDGQDEFSQLEIDGIEKAVEVYFQVPSGYAAAFCSFMSAPREVYLIKWRPEDEAVARPSRV